VLNIFSDEYEFKHGAVFKESTKSNLICIHPFDSPYYKSALSGSGEEYTEYIKKSNQHIENKKCKDLPRSWLKFLNLIESFDVKNMPKIDIYWNSSIQKFTIIDGNHRFTNLLLKNLPLKKEFFELKNH